jgi:hypothetical protein
LDHQFSSVVSAREREGLTRGFVVDVQIEALEEEVRSLKKSQRIEPAREVEKGKEKEKDAEA